MFYKHLASHEALQYEDHFVNKMSGRLSITEYTVLRDHFITAVFILPANSSKLSTDYLKNWSHIYIVQETFDVVLGLLNQRAGN